MPTDLDGGFRTVTTTASLLLPTVISSMLRSVPTQISLGCQCTPPVRLQRTQLNLSSQPRHSTWKHERALRGNTACTLYTLVLCLCQLHQAADPAAPSGDAKQA